MIMFQTDLLKYKSKYKKVGVLCTIFLSSCRFSDDTKITAKMFPITTRCQTLTRWLKDYISNFKFAQVEKMVLRRDLLI